MTKVYTILASGGEHLPLEDQVNPLLPASYDIVWSVLSLLVIAILFWKFVLPKFHEVLDERADRIEGGIQRAEVAQAEAQQALAKYNAQLSEARHDAERIREEARDKGKKIVDDMRAEAQEESARILEAGGKELLAQRERVVAELRNEIGQHSIALAERLLGEQLSDHAKRSETIDAFLSSLDNVSPAGK